MATSDLFVSVSFVLIRNILRRKIWQLIPLATSFHQYLYSTVAA